MDTVGEWAPIDSITAWDKNPRNNDHAVQAVADSIQRFGWGNPILVRRADRVVIGGHTRLKAARLLGMDKVPIRLMDLDPAQAAALALADNKLGELADWDDAGLREVLAELEADGLDLEGLGWSDEELEGLLASGSAALGEEGAEAPPVDRGEAHSEAGVIYELGPHLLLCGSNRETRLWEEQFGPVDAVVTDPPYGIDASVMTMGSGESRKPRSERLSAVKEWDSEAPDVSWMLEVASMVCVWGGNYFPGLPVSDDWLVWDKKNAGLSFSEAELAWTNYGCRVRLLSHNWSGEKKLHITMKPLPVIKWSLSFTPAGSTVLDPFAGSGSTLIACAQTGRIARLIELDPHYCDVIRRRWTQYARDNGVDPGPGTLEPLGRS